MRYASIDIGTNTVLLLVADLDEQGTLKVIQEEYRAPRLGRGVDRDKNLHPDSMKRVMNVLDEYHKIVNDRYPEVEAIRVVATSAVRDSNNRGEFIDAVYKTTGLSVDLLSGGEEAEFTYKGAVSVLPEIHDSVTVLDIGGGSTEVATGWNNDLNDRHSFNIGSVRYTERFFKHDPPTLEEKDDCRMHVSEELRKRSFNLPADTTLVGVAGTPTSLAYIIKDMDEFDGSALNGMAISSDQVRQWIEKIECWSSEELLEQYPVVMDGRSDVFLAGLLILDRFINLYDLKGVLASTGGIRHGAILDMAGK